jgi:hypothetical protein
MGNLIWGWSVVYAIGVAVYAMYLVKRYFWSSKK